MTTRVTLNPTTEQFEAQDMNNPGSLDVSTSPSSDTTTVSINKHAAASGRVTVRNGQASYEEVGPQRVTTSQVDPNMVMVGGMATPRAVAEQLLAAGDISPDLIQDPSGQLGKANWQEAPATPSAASVEPRERSSDTSPEVAKAEAVVNQALTQLDAELGGPTSTNDAMLAVAQSGELPGADELASLGVDAGKVNEAVEAFTGFANAAIAETGVDVSVMSQLLNDADLKAARVAAVTGNTSDLRQLADKAKARLSRLGTDREAFSDFMRENGWDYQYRFDPQGRAEVYVDQKYGWMPWAQLVASGSIRFDD